MPRDIALILRIKKELDGFLMGERSLNILYDNFFRKIFNPEEHRDRVARLPYTLHSKKNVKSTDCSFIQDYERPPDQLIGRPLLCIL